MIKLYSKKLNSLEELRHEKALKKAAAHSPVNNPTENNTSSTDSSDEILNMIQTGFDVITSKGVVNKLFAIALPALSIAVQKLEKDLLKSFAKEFIAGYAKWKAIELSAKALLSLINRKRKEKED